MVLKSFIGGDLPWRVYCQLSESVLDICCIEFGSLVKMHDIQRTTPARARGWGLFHSKDFLQPFSGVIPLRRPRPSHVALVAEDILFFDGLIHMNRLQLFSADKVFCLLRIVRGVSHPLQAIIDAPHRQFKRYVRRLAIGPIA